MTTRSGAGGDRPDPGLTAIISERRLLINLTYRLLGSLAEAEDAVQETYARWYAMSREQQEAIESPGAWLTTVAGRICLNLRLGPGPARDLRRRVDPGAAAGAGGGDHRTAERPPPSTRPIGSPSMNRSAWPSSSCSIR